MILVFEILVISLRQKSEMLMNNDRITDKNILQNMTHHLTVVITRYTIFPWYGWRLAVLIKTASSEFN